MGLHEFTFRNHFSIPFSFEVFNTYWVKLSGSGEYIIPFDPWHIRKSGKLTLGRGKFWSGCHKAVKEGLEIAGFALVDMKINTAVLSYLYQVERTGKRGGPQTFDGRAEIHAPNPAHLKEVYSDDDEMQVYGGVVYSKSLGKEIAVAIVSYFTL